MEKEPTPLFTLKQRKNPLRTTVYALAGACMLLLATSVTLGIMYKNKTGSSGPGTISGVSLNIGTFNILADNLCEGEFVSAGGDEKVKWTSREANLVKILTEMLKVSDVVVTQENDHFFSVLNKLNLDPDLKGKIKGVYVVKEFPSEHSNNSIKNIASGRVLRLTRIYNNILIATALAAHSGDAKDFDPKKVSGLVSGSPADIKLKYNDMYRTVNANKTYAGRLTFEQECGAYAEDFAKTYGYVETDTTVKACTKDDVYITADGVGVYYNTDKLTLVEAKTGESGGVVMTKMIKDVPIEFNDDGFVKIKFTTKKDNKPFSLIGGHMPSGETVESESERSDVFKKMMDLAGTDEPLFVAMDSNTGKNYEADIRASNVGSTATVGLKYLSQLISESKLTDSVPQTGYECFKMRHNAGSQPRKFCELVFDTIDKILYKGATVKALGSPYDANEFTFKKYTLANNIPLSMARSKADLRDLMANSCLLSAFDKEAKFKTDKSNDLFEHIFDLAANNGEGAVDNEFKDVTVTQVDDVVILYEALETAKKAVKEFKPTAVGADANDATKKNADTSAKDILEQKVTEEKNKYESAIGQNLLLKLVVEERGKLPGLRSKLNNAPGAVNTAQAAFDAARQALTAATPATTDADRKALEEAVKVAETALGDKKKELKDAPKKLKEGQEFVLKLLTTAEFSQDKDERTKLLNGISVIATEKAQFTAVFNEIYPNENAPSDHPPVVSRFLL